MAFHTAVEKTMRDRQLTDRIREDIITRQQLQALRRASVRTYADLVGKDEVALVAINNFGRPGFQNAVAQMRKLGFLQH